jgi:hypothetical protein
MRESGGGVLLQEAVDEGERRWRGEVEEVDAE